MPVTMARGKVAVKAAPSGSIQRTFLPEKDAVPTHCPLCIEEMDETDLQFTPCPCGYRVCLFCYDRVKQMCNSLCPGCRREYGKAEEAPAPGLSEAARGKGSGGGAAGNDGSTGGGTRAFTTQSSANSIMSVPAPPPRPPAPPPKPNAAAGPAGTAQLTPRPQQAAGRDPGRDQPGLPSGATWAAAGASSAQPAAPVVADESAWPSLAATAAASQAQQGGHTHQNGHARRGSHTASTNHHHGADSSGGGDAQSHHRTSSHASSATVDRVASANSIDAMSQDPIVPPEQLAGLGGNAGGLASMAGAGAGGAGLGAYHGAAHVPNATVTTSVLGVQRTVNVQLPHTSIEPYPEAASTLTNLNQGMRAGTITSKEAAAQLVALLKMREVQNGKVPQGPKAPPGFAAPITPPPGFGGSGGFGSAISVAGGSGGQQQGASSQFFSPNDQPVTVTPPALGRYQPIGTRTSAVGAGGLGGLQDTHGVSDGLGNGSSLQGNGTTNGGASYSMWGGLPGLGGGLGGASTSYNPLIGVLGSSQWSTQAGGASGTAAYLPWASSFGDGQQQGALAGLQTGLAAKVPPPGFGGPAASATVGLGAAGTDKGLASNGYRSYNPLLAQQSAAAVSQRPEVPPGLSYRPALGTQL